MCENGPEEAMRERSLRWTRAQVGRRSWEDKTSKAGNLGPDVMGVVAAAAGVDLEVLTWSFLAESARKAAP